MTDVLTRRDEDTDDTQQKRKTTRGHEKTSSNLQATEKGSRRSHSATP